MTLRKSSWIFLSLAAFAAAAFAQDNIPKANRGYTDTPLVPGQKWHVHDPGRPYPPKATPGAKPGAPPSDAIVLFDGKDLSHWLPATQITPAGPTTREGPPKWKVENGYMEIVPGTGDLETKEKFGNVQLHVEFALPTTTAGSTTDRGNTGIFLQGRYELQIFDQNKNPIYADGQIGAIYGQWPPLVDAGLKPGEWQTYDILFEAPKMSGDKVIKPAYLTAILNGMVVQNHTELLGPTVYRAAAKYTAQPAEDGILIQNHNSAVRFRNIWARRLN